PRLFIRPAKFARASDVRSWQDTAQPVPAFLYAGFGDGEGARLPQNPGDRRSSPPKYHLAHRLLLGWRRSIAGWIDHAAIVANLSTFRKLRRLDSALAHQVKNGLAARDQIVGHNPPVAAPPHRFRAHHGAALFPTERNQLHQ